MQTTIQNTHNCIAVVLVLNCCCIAIVLSLYCCCHKINLPGFNDLLISEARNHTTKVGICLKR